MIKLIIVAILGFISGFAACRYSNKKYIHFNVHSDKDISAEEWDNLRNQIKDVISEEMGDLYEQHTLRGRDKPEGKQK